MTQTIEITIEVPENLTEPRHRAEITASPTPIFEEIVADTGFRPATRFIERTTQGKHVG